jgi:NADH dehydrogenase
MLRPHIVILGAGFGGMYVARHLKHLAKKGAIDLTIVNETNYFLFTPLLHEVATGSLAPASVAEPIREIFAHSGVRIVQGTVEAIDRGTKTVHILGDINSEETHHHPSHDIKYDFLVIATGAATNYYNIPGADIFTYPLKTLSDAALIRDRIIDSFEEAVLSLDPALRAKLLSFAIVGGGATGVETAAEVADFVDGIVKRYYNDTDCKPGDPPLCSPEEPTVSLIHTGPELLQVFAPSLRAAAEKRLRQRKVVLHLGSTVTEVSPHGLKLSNNTTVPASTVIWAAGVKPSMPRFEGGEPAITAGRLAVDEYFRLQGDERVFALGDMAAYVDVDVLMPMLAQVAVGQAKIVAHNIRAVINKKSQKTFHYHSKGSMVSVGSWFAIGEIYSMKISGKLTWWLWRSVYLFKFFSWKKRIRIVLSWTLNTFYPRDITKLH